MGVVPLPLRRIARGLFAVGRFGAIGHGLVACGSSGAAPASKEVDAAGIDGSSEPKGASTTPQDGSSEPQDASSEPQPDGGTSLDGSMAFGVHYSVVYPQNLDVSCGYAPSAGNGYGDLVVLLANVDLSTMCSSGTFPPSASGHPAVRIEVESPSYAMGGAGLAADGGPVAALGPGSYAIGFDGSSSIANVCELSHTTGSALVDVLDVGDSGCCNTPVGTSVSGTVTLTAVEPGHVAGTFLVSLAPVQGATVVTQSAAPFSGRFDTTPCPGTVQ
jgi:hypothetical protein